MRFPDKTIHNDNGAFIASGERTRLACSPTRPRVGHSDVERTISHDFKRRIVLATASQAGALTRSNPKKYFLENSYSKCPTRGRVGLHARRVRSPKII